MARRKDHTPEQLRRMMRAAARKIIKTKGLGALSARSLAKAIGYAPGTIYNFYRDMDALVSEVNCETLKLLEDECRKKIELLPNGISKVRELAFAYVDFAHENTGEWEAIFLRDGTDFSRKKLSKAHKERIESLFSIIENTLMQCLQISSAEAAGSARLLWACLHGISVLTLDGRLRLIGVESHRKIISDLLKKYFGR